MRRHAANVAQASETLLRARLGGFLEHPLNASVQERSTPRKSSVHSGRASSGNFFLSKHLQSVACVVDSIQWLCSCTGSPRAQPIRYGSSSRVSKVRKPARYETVWRGVQFHTAPPVGLCRHPSRRCLPNSKSTPESLAYQIDPRHLVNVWDFVCLACCRL